MVRHDLGLYLFSFTLNHNRHLNRDPEIYGPDADRFRPERHLDQQGNLRDPKDDGHFTFGFGQRSVIFYEIDDV